MTRCGLVLHCLVITSVFAETGRALVLQLREDLGVAYIYSHIALHPLSATFLDQAYAR